MKKYFKKIAIISIILNLFIPNSMVLTADDSAFNQNFIISDEEIQNWSSMNREDIQAFLKEYDSYLVNYSAESIDGLKRSASDIIYRASMEHRINPKYMLGKLQKEQSLITDKNPTQKQLEWATGYGICDSCSMSDPTLQKHKGFGTQVDSAAAIIRWYYDNLNKEIWIKRANNVYNIDGTVVRPLNLATAFLYTYTPHIQGNKNFWILWQKWFDQIYPNGSLVKSADSQTIYLLKDGEKKPFKNMSALITRFDPKLIINIPINELKNYPTGTEISLPNYSILNANGKYYLLDDDTIRPFASSDTVKQFGYNPDEIININANDLSGYKIGAEISSASKAPLGKLVRIKENKQLYYLTEHIFYSITDDQLAKINYPHLSIENGDVSNLTNLNQGEAIKFKDGTIFGIEGNNKIYVIENGKKRHIANEEVFNGLGFNWKNIIWTNQFTGLNHSTGQPIYLKKEIEIADSIVTAIPEFSVAESISADKMIRTPEDKTSYIGKQFDTNINTYLIADYDSKEILVGKNMDDARPMASFAKVMTAYVLMKDGVNLERSVTYDPADHKSVYHNFRIVKGEKILNKNLMYSGLVSSINTAMRMLVDSVAENENNFIKQMNEQIETWGLTKTKFTDVTGEDLDNKTTARDYLAIYLNSTKNTNVNDFLSVKSYEYAEIVDMDNLPRHFDDNSNDLIKEQHQNFKILNSKTGYLDEAGAGLVMTVERQTDGKKFVIITMGNPNLNNRFAEGKRLTDWVITNF